MYGRKQILFKNYPYARYAADSRFQQANRTSGLNFTDEKVYLSEKHKMYGFKLEVSILISDIYIHSSSHVAGSVAGITFFRQTVIWRYTATEKMEDERHGQDSGELEKAFPNYWKIIANKGYQGLVQSIRVSILQKR